MMRYLCLLLGLIAPVVAQSQSFRDYPPRWSVSAGWQQLFTTHNTWFAGGDLVLSRRLTPRWAVGLGTEYAHTRFHDDNGWSLYNVRFLPVFADARLRLSGQSRLQPYLRAASGVSFAAYQKHIDNTPGAPYPVRERGLYLYGAAGVALPVTQRIAPLLEVGFKGFHFSRNDLDVNPHGVTFRLALAF